MNKSKGLMNFTGSKTWNLVNDQYNREFATAMLFFEYAAEADRLGMTNFSNLLQNWAKEELEHAGVFYEYLDSRDSWAKTNDLALTKLLKPFNHPREIAQALSEYQASVSDIMVEIANVAIAEKDPATLYFIEHFVKDQIIEEKKCIEINDAFENSQDLTTADLMLRKIDRKYHQPQEKPHEH
ncbi:ferritin [Mycoplasmoides fastidiosum]|uniref:Ferritin n=1 Tax=Mycoplasmoides fastidiosum TaxID=92758 RepID=A0ABU0LZ24_9BACT|nr:ferritin-like domain-containing protein [Mycoplasmoides fastidiosum]MDQ0513932.1 ferritin [Mycoplasmoides fastidiosum]UUD37654.1 ferritin [Mycoplasmoides fastidiosum]